MHQAGETTKGQGDRACCAAPPAPLHTARVLVQWLLPLRDNDGARFQHVLFVQVREEMTAAFGGITAYPHSPAIGLWEDEGEVRRDELVLFEVLVESLDRAWWADYRDGLCRRFRQEAIQLRVIPCEVL